MEMILLSAKASEPAVETVTETAKKDKYKQNVGLKKKRKKEKRMWFSFVDTKKSPF